jgi:hypothetical protein
MQMALSGFGASSRLRRFVALAPLLALTACASPGVPSGAPSGTPAPGQTGGQPAPPPAASLPPLSVTVTTDESRAATQVVPVEGGTLTATGADGTSFVLTMPANALVEPTEITMTPLTSMTGLLADDTLLAGVQLGPDGLALYDLATLEIKMPGYQAKDLEIGLAYSGDGEQLHAHPLDLDTSTLRMHLSHFSGAGAARGKAGIEAAQALDRERAGYFQGQLDAEIAQVSQKIARAIIEDRQSVERGEPPRDPSAMVDDLSSPEMMAILKWALDQAEQYADDCDALQTVDAGLRTFMAFQRQLELLGTESSSPEITALEEQAQRIYAKVEEAARKCLCSDQLQPARVSAYLGFVRMRSILGTAGEGEFLPTCEWDFTMNVTSDTPDFHADWTGKFSFAVLDVLKGSDLTGTGGVTGEMVSTKCTVPTNLGGGTKTTTGRFLAAAANDVEMKGRAVVEGKKPDWKVFFELDPVLANAESFDYQIPNPDGCLEIANSAGLFYLMWAPNEVLGPLKVEARDGATADSAITSESGSIRRQAKIEVVGN